MLYKAWHIQGLLAIIITLLCRRSVKVDFGDFSKKMEYLGLG